MFGSSKCSSGTERIIILGDLVISTKCRRFGTPGLAPTHSPTAAVHGSGPYAAIRSARSSASSSPPPWHTSKMQSAKTSSAQEPKKHLSNSFKHPRKNGYSKGPNPIIQDHPKSKTSHFAIFKGYPTWTPNFVRPASDWLLASFGKCLPQICRASCSPSSPHSFGLSTWAPRCCSEPGVRPLTLAPRLTPLMRRRAYCSGRETPGNLQHCNRSQLQKTDHHKPHNTARCKFQHSGRPTHPA